VQISPPGHPEFEATLEMADSRSGDPQPATIESNGQVEALAAAARARDGRLGAGSESISQRSLAASEASSDFQASDPVAQQGAAIAKSDGGQAASESAAVPRTENVQAISAGSASVIPAAHETDAEGGLIHESGAMWQTGAAMVVHALRALVLPAEAADNVSSIQWDAGATWLPQLAGVLGDALPTDSAAVERELREILGQVNSLARQVAHDMVSDGGSWRLAAVAAITAGARLAIRQSRKRGGNPSLVLCAADPTWGWVLGSPGPRRS
jgi:hypothetical protein